MPEDRDSEIWDLAQAGVPHHEIAERFSISRQRVGQIVADRTPAAWGFTDRDRALVRAKEAAVLAEMARELEAVIRQPPLQHSAIGKPIEDPRRPGTYLINEAVRVQAIRERRLNSESLRRLTGSDLVASDRNQGLDADMQRQIDEITQAQAARRGRLAIAGTPAAAPKPSDVPWTYAQVDGVWTITSSEATA